jgi:cation-transporting ATPase E
MLANPPTLDTTLQGLSTPDVQTRQAQGKDNRFKARVARTYPQIIRENVFNLFNIVLFSLLIIVLMLGDYSTVFFAGFSVVSNTFLGMIQEMNAKRRLDRLATLSEQRVRALRDGRWQEIAMREVVLDDVLWIEPGDKLVVDGVVIKADSLEMDESLLTGESDAVFKEVGSEVFSGSFCLAGSGVMRATRVGAESNINKLSSIAKQYKRSKTPTQVYIDIVVEITTLVMFVLVPMVFVAGYLAQIEFLQAMRNAVVFVTSLVPQGLVLVAILSLTIGAIKISLKRTLIQRVNAVESLGNATVLCFDKTGTLTKNQLEVTEVIPLSDVQGDALYRPLMAYLLALAHRNRTAAAVLEHVQARTAPANGTTPAKLREVPFTSGRKWGAIVFANATYALGAPERLLSDTATLERVVALSNEGYRVLAFVKIDGTLDEANVRAQAQGIALIALSDQPRENIQETLASFKADNIALKVISGDSLETVRAIANQSGMGVTQGYTGAQIEAMSDGELDNVVEEANLFARIEPHSKQRIVSALQRRGHYVAMVGDGVNDVPALKQANLAIVMNDGTQISKDIADIVLLDNAMSTLPLAFKEGREITQTIYGTMKLFLVKNVYNVLLFIFVAFMSLPFPITPVQISWSTFGTVNMPATLVAVAILRPSFMRRFRDDVLEFIFTGGFIGAVMLAFLYAYVYFYEGRDVVAARTAVTLFVTFYGAWLVCVVMGMDFYRPHTLWERRRLLLIMLGFTLMTVFAMYAIPSLFEFKIMTWERDSGVILSIALLFVLSIVLLAHGEKYRYLVRRLWHLFQ